MFTIIRLFLKSYWSVILGITYLVILLFLNEVPADDADGLEHFSIANDSWKHPDLFLHHWGKPLFTFLFSFLAQLGYKAYVLTNVLVYFFTCIVAKSLLTSVSNRSHLFHMFSLGLLTVPDYITSCIGGLTEPLFGLLIVLIIQQAQQERWITATLLTSFLPFSRSEGMFAVLLFAGVLLLAKQWRLVPLLGAAWVLSLLLGALLIHQANWYFENDPYPSQSIYGSGPWNTYLLSVPRHLGYFLLFLLVLTFICVLYYKKTLPNLTDKRILLSCFGIGLHVGILLVHSYLWYTGQKGALGLSRLGTLGVPGSLLITLWALGSFTRLRLAQPRDGKWGVILAFVSAVYIFCNNPYPKKANPMQLELKQAAEYLEAHQDKFHKAFYSHPMIAYYSGTTSRSSHPYLSFRFLHLEDDLKKTITDRDIIVRDSDFGAREQGLPFDAIAKCKVLLPIKHFYPPSHNIDGYGEYQSVIIYRKVKFAEAYQNAAPTSLLIPNRTILFDTKEMYSNVDSSLIIPQRTAPLHTLVFEARSILPINNELALVIDGGKNYYQAIRIGHKQQSYAVSITQPLNKVKLYLYNPSRAHINLSFKLIRWEITHDIGL